MLGKLFSWNKVNCKSCGRRIDKDQVYCRFCGAKQIENEETAGRHTEAIIKKLLDNYQAILNNHLSEANTRFQLGVIYKLRGMLDEALLEFKAASSIDKNSAEYYTAMASIESARRRYSEAVVYYKKALDLHPGYADLHNNLGVAYYKQENLDDAISEFKKAIEINPKYANAHNNMGMAYRKKGSGELAEKEFKEAQNLDGEGVMADYELGRHYYSGGMFDENKSLKDIDAKTLGDLFFTAKMFNEALGQYEAEAKKNPGFADIHYRIGIACRELGRIEDARREFKKAMEINPNYKEAREGLAKLKGGG